MRAALALAAWLAAAAPAWGCVESAAVAVGEALHYDIAWMGIPAGRATIAVEPPVAHRDRTAVRLVATARSNAFVDAFYEVRVEVESLWDCQGRYSLLFTHRGREGRRVRDRRYVFDLPRQEVRREWAGDPVERFPLLSPVQDPFSILFEARVRPLEVGRTFTLEAFEGRRRWEVDVQVLRRQRVTVPAGTFDAIVVKPLLKFEGVFQQKGDVVVWLTDDERRIPVRMESKVRIGRVAAELTSFVRP
ncbi:MAG TPA: DUF3108 domain-containing protein [Thermodesulfobacteriota bacterium]